MKKIFTLLVFSFFALSTQLYGQVAGSFNIITQKWRFDATTEQYLASNGYIVGAKCLSEPYIFGSGDPNYANLDLVKGFLTKFFPDPASSEYMFINWEKGPYVAMRKYKPTDAAFKKGEAEIIRLITEIKKVRPKLKITLYNMPYRFWYSYTNDPWNGTGTGEKFHNVLSKLDFIAPSLYTLYPDEEVGHERNVQYLKENLNVALAYGKKYNKEVIPFIWHRVAIGLSTTYQKQIIQKAVFAETIKFIANYSYNNYKSSGVWWYDGNGQFEDLKGINNCLNGTVHNESTYYAMIRDYAKHIKQVLNANTPTPTTPTTTAQKVVSYTLINADTDKDIQTIAAGATLNLSTLPTKNLNIRVNTNPATVGSVKLVLSDKLAKTVTDGETPYALFGSTGTNYTAWVPAVGSYTLTATPYTAANGGGTAGTPLTIKFSVTTQYSLTVAATNGSVTKSPNQTSYLSGSVVKLTATPAAGYKFSGWSGGVTSTTNPLSVTMSGNKTITANFVPVQYSLNVSTVGNGTVTKSLNLTSFVKGTIVTLTATPAPGYQFSGWSGAATGTSNTLPITIDANKNITATFIPVPVEYSLTVGAAGSGMVTKSIEQNSYTKGTTVTLTAIPATGYQFTGWSGDNTGTTNPLSITIDSTISITANFIPVLAEYSLTVGAIGSGMVTKSIEQGNYAKGTIVTLTATPAAGYQFSGWSGDTTGTTNPLAVTIKSNKNITANFTLVQQTIQPAAAAKIATTNTETTLANTASIYPNPATTTLHVEVGVAGAGLSEITLNDLTGRVVLTKKISNSGQSLNTELDVQNLESGVYIVSVNTPKGRTSKRIVVQ